jgi:hypothetical protein
MGWAGSEWSVRIASHLVTSLNRAVQDPCRTWQNMKHGGFGGSTRQQRLDPIASHTANLTCPNSPIILRLNISSHCTSTTPPLPAPCTCGAGLPQTFSKPAPLSFDSTVRLHTPENRAIQLIPDPSPSIERNVLRYGRGWVRCEGGTGMQRCAGSGGKQYASAR